MDAEFRIDQASPGAGVAGRTRHDLVSGEAITLVATAPTGPGITYTWEILDKVGSTATLSSSTGQTVQITPPEAILRPCSFRIKLTVNNNGVVTHMIRRASVRTLVTGVFAPLFPESAPSGGTLSSNSPDLSEDNAVYPNRAGLGVADQNWRGWSEWAYEIVLAVENGGGSGGLPSGAAGGDLGDTYPNPSVRKLYGRAIDPAAPSNNNYLRWDSGTSSWRPTAFPTGLPPTGAAGGDLTSNYPSPQVTGLRGITVEGGTPAVNDVLRFDGTVWKLHYQGAFINGSTATPSIYFGTNTDTGLWSPEDGAVGVSGDGLEIARFQAPSGASPQLLLANGSDAAPALSFASDPDTGLRSGGDNVLGFDAGGVQRMYLSVAALNISVNVAPTASSTYDLGIGARPFRDGYVGRVIGSVLGGTEAEPTFTWSGDTNTGLFHPVGRAVAVSSDGGEIVRFTRQTSVTDTPQVLIATGSDPTTRPHYSFLSNLDTGMSFDAGGLAFYVDGGRPLLLTNLASVPRAIFQPGNASNPIITFDLDNNTGIYSPGVGIVAITTSGVERARFTATNSLLSTHWLPDVTETRNLGASTKRWNLSYSKLFEGDTGRFQTVQITSDGNASSPSIVWSTFGDNGFFNAGADRMGVTVDGVEVMRWRNATSTNPKVLLPDGSLAHPSLGFISDEDTGLHRPATNTLGIITGGVRLAALQQALVAATGDEAAIDLSVTVNKATSGNYTALKLDVTESSAPGTDDVLLDLRVGGTTKMRVDNTGRVQASFGTEALPGLSFFGDPDTGLYMPGAGSTLRFSVQGAGRFQMGTNNFSPTASNAYSFGAVTLMWSRAFVGPGAAATPSINLGADGNTGLYQTGTTTTQALGLSVNGASLGTMRQALVAATGDETAIDLTVNVNKLTSGNYTGIKLNVTEAKAPGTDDRLIDLQVGGTSMFLVNNVGNVHIGPPGNMVAATRSLFFNSGDGTTARQPEITARTDGGLEVFADDNSGLRLTSNATVQAVGSSGGKWTLGVSNDGVGLNFLSRLTSSTTVPAFAFPNTPFGSAFTASAGRQTLASFTTSINQTGTATYTGLLVNITETAAPGTDNRLLDLQVGGATRFLVLNTGVAQVADGALTTPSMSFLNDPDTGWLNSGPLGAAGIGGIVNGALVALLTDFGGGPQLHVEAGTVGVPSLAIDNFASGLYAPSGGTVAAVSQGAEVFRWSAPGGGTPQLLAVAGDAGDPVYSFAADTGSGLYRAGVGSPGIAAGGIAVWSWTPDAALSATPIELAGATLGTPSEGSTRIGVTDTLGRPPFLSKVDSYFPESFLETAWHDRQKILAMPSGGPSMEVLGMTTATSGTVSFGTPTSTNWTTACLKQQLVTAATTNATADIHATSPVAHQGAAGRGGWMFHARFGLGANHNTNTRMLVGMVALSTTISGASNPSTLSGTAFAAVALNSGSSVLMVYYNDGGGAPGAFNTGITVAPYDAFDVWLWVEPSSPTLNVHIQRVNGGAAGVSTTMLSFAIGANVWVYPHAWIATAETAPKTLYLMRMFIETPQ